MFFLNEAPLFSRIHLNSLKLNSFKISSIEWNARSTAYWLSQKLRQQHPLNYFQIIKIYWFDISSKEIILCNFGSYYCTVSRCTKNLFGYRTVVLCASMLVNNNTFFFLHLRFHWPPAIIFCWKAKETANL